ncbi:MAG: mannitol dehydrogenase family protein [Pseudomonadota bacterium]
MTRTPAALRRDRLTDLPVDVERPTYAVTDLSPGIVHIGVGNFHRAHQAWYLHRLMQQGAARDWAIIGAGVRPGDARMRETLRAQDYLTTLIELRPDASSAEVTGAMIDFFPVEADNASLIAGMAHPSTRIVSLTVTEGGYFVNPATGSFDACHPDILHDAQNPNTPRTAFGAIVAALALRRAEGAGSFTIQSCDNVQGNGDVTRAATVSLARLSDPDLAEWIDRTCSFPNSMVDCIVPTTGPAEVQKARAIGIEDAAPVTHEFYRQWVMEDDFCAGRPDWDLVGATFTDRVHDYETMKIRVLNGGHQVLANVGELLSVPTIADCMAHPLISAFFRKVVAEEIVPYVTPVPDHTPKQYSELVAQRFSNPAILDTTRRVAFDGSSRHPGFVLPSVRDALAVGGPVEGLALVEALWARMCAGQREDGSTIEPNDPQWEVLQQTALAAKAHPHLWLDQSTLYGRPADLGRFTASFERSLADIWANGVERTVGGYTKGR